MIDVLKERTKEDVVVRIVITLTKGQLAVPIIAEKVNYYLKTYEKDSFIIPAEGLAREIGKYISLHTDIVSLGWGTSIKTTIKS
jgi:hypothetical protein